MRTRPLMLVCAFGALALSATATHAAPSPDDARKNAGPAISLQAKSIEELLDTVKATAKNFLPESIYKEFDKEALGKLDLQQLKGIDTKKPFGFYATLDPSLKDGDFSKSSAVVLVPVTDEKEFLELVAKRGITPAKKGEIYSIPIPNSPIDASMRFLKGYAYIGFAGEKLDAKLLLDPAEVISAKETAAAVLRFRLDRIPLDLKEAGIQFLGQAADAAREAPVPPEAKGILEDWLKMATRLIKLGLDDGKEAVYRFDLDPKQGTLVVEFTIDGKPGSALAKSIAAIKPTKNDFTNIIGSDSAAHAVFQPPLFIDEVQSFLLKAIAIGEKQADDSLRGAPMELSNLASEALKALKRTVKSGDLDLAASLRGPDKNEHFTAIGAVSLKETAALEKAIKAALKLAPKEAAAAIQIDAFKVDEINVHELALGDKLPPDARKVFGKGTLYAAFAPDALYVTFGAQGKELMKEALSVKPSPKPAPLLNVEISGKRLITLIKNAGAPVDGPGGEFLAKFGQMERLTLLSVKLEGGDKLVVRKEIGFVPLAASFGVQRKAAIMQAPLRVRPPVKAAPPSDE